MHAFSTTAPRAAIAAAVGLLAVAPAAAQAKTQSVDVTFAAMAGSKPVACGSPIAGLGMAKATAQLRDLRFYVSDVALIRKDGKAVPVKLRGSSVQLTREGGSVTLIDLENGTGACAEEGTKATNARVRGTVPEGSYKGLSYTVGVPSALNHTDVAGAPSPLNLAALGWSWQFGRKFLKIETADPTFLVHLGSTGCTGNPATGQKVTCTSSNRVKVRFASFNPSRQRVAVDVQTLLAGTDLAGGMGAMASSAMQMDMANSCMSGPGEKPCGSIFKALGLAWNDTSGGGKATASAQKVFRAIAR